MTLEEFYNRTGGQFKQVATRLMSEDRVKKYVFKFKDDESLMKIRRALDEKDYNEAFMHTHNLKGVCLNLSFDGLLGPVSVLCEELRDGMPGADLEGMYEDLRKAYTEFKELIISID